MFCQDLVTFAAYEYSEANSRNPAEALTSIDEVVRKEMLSISSQLLLSHTKTTVYQWFGSQIASKALVVTQSRRDQRGQEPKDPCNSCLRCPNSFNGQILSICR